MNYGNGSYNFTTQGLSLFPFPGYAGDIESVIWDSKTAINWFNKSQEFKIEEGCQFHRAVFILWILKLLYSQPKYKLKWNSRSSKHVCLENWTRKSEGCESQLLT